MKSTYSHSLSLEALPDELRPLVRERPTVWLVGAGISHPSPTNLPLGHDFISGIIDAVQPNPGIGNRLKQLCGYDRESRRGTADYLRFEGILSLLQQTIDPGLVILDCMREERIPNGYHYFLAKLINVTRIMLRNISLSLMILSVIQAAHLIHSEFFVRDLASAIALAAASTTAGIQGAKFNRWFYSAVYESAVAHTLDLSRLVTWKQTKQPERIEPAGKTNTGDKGHATKRPDPNDPRHNL